MTRTVFKLIRLGALAAPALSHMTRAGTMQEKVKWVIRDYTGWDEDTGTWQGHYLLRGWGAYLGAVLATYGIPKLAGIIRKI